MLKSVCQVRDNRPIIDMVYWDEELDAWIITAEGGSRISRPQSYYTHWMPLPEPPAIRSSQT